MNIAKKILFISCVLMTLISRVQAEEVVQFATDPWPPFFLETDSDRVTQGLGVELVKAIFARIPGVTPEFPKLPWKRALLEVEHGSKDALALLLRSKKREKYMVFSAPVMKTEGVLFFNKKRFPEGFSWQSVEDLKPFRIGVVQGYVYGDLLDSYIATESKNVFKVTRSKQLFSMLQRQHIDLVPESLAVAKGIVAEQGWSEDLGLVNKPINEDILHIGFSKKSTFLSLLPEINKVLYQLHQEGVIDGLLGDVGKSAVVMP